MDDFMIPLSRMNPIGQNSLGTLQGPRQNEVMIPFSDIFSGMIQTVQATDTSVKGSEVATAIGDVDRLHDLTIASTKAGLALDLFVQLRNKGHDAYSEIIRMSV